MAYAFNDDKSKAKIGTFSVDSNSLSISANGHEDYLISLPYSLWGENGFVLGITEILCDTGAWVGSGHSLIVQSYSVDSAQQKIKLIVKNDTSVAISGFHITVSGTYISAN